MSCSDNNPCTLGDTCDAGVCAGEALDCSTLNGPCNTASCDPTSGVCVSTAINELKTCDDESQCTYNDRCTDGVCQGIPYDCSSLATPCREAGCDPATGACTTTDAPDGTVCDDYNACTFEGTCLSGFCQTVPLSCTAFADICNYGSCDPEVGECYSEPKPNGAGCSDNDPCTATSSCQDGECTGTPKDCSELDGPCKSGFCNSFNGYCDFNLAEDGTAWNDGDSCTGNDACNGVTMACGTTAGVCQLDCQQGNNACANTALNCGPQACIASCSGSTTSG